MAGKTLHRSSNNDQSDPFIAGQMIGMLVILTFVEKNQGIPMKVLEQLKQVAANNAQEFLGKPSEDIFLMVDNLVKDIK